MPLEVVNDGEAARMTATGFVEAHGYLLDSGTPILLKGLGTTSSTDPWSRNVVEGVDKLTATIIVDQPGDHVLKLWMVDAAITVDQIVIDTGGLPATYLAPPESSHPRFNPAPPARRG